MLRTTADRSASGLSGVKIRIGRSNGTYFNPANATFENTLPAINFPIGSVLVPQGPPVQQWTAAAAQKVTLNLMIKPWMTIQKVNRVNGKLETPEMKKAGEEAGRFLLELDLPGGTGELICITTSKDRE